MPTKYLSAKKLKITDGERKWLIKFMNMAKTQTPAQARRIDGLSVKFNMARWVAKGTDRGTLCGMIACIGGTMGLMAIAAGQKGDLRFYKSAPDADDMADRIADSDRVLFAANGLNWRFSRALDELFTPPLCGLERGHPEAGRQGMSGVSDHRQARFRQRHRI